MRTLEGISVIVPVHNGAKHLEGCVEKIIRSLRKGGVRDYQIIIAEDGSSDGSGRIAERIAARTWGVEALAGGPRLGKGKAIACSVRRCRHERIVFLDVDAHLVAERIVPAARLLADADLAIGTRYAKSSRHSRPLYRDVLSRGYHALVELAFGGSFSDYQCGFKSFRKSTAGPICRSVESRGWFWDTEFLLKARKAGLTVREIPVDWREKESSLSGAAQQAAELFIELVKYSAWQLSRGQGK
ncbi:TPA: glycosyltransferase [Candidatus Micrarchaeota archaeon]|nr:glycosyltransferase [Candidatus Micrarchaeota archaeon]